MKCEELVKDSGKKAEVGFEPTNNGFAIRPLSPLGYSAGILDDIAGGGSDQVGLS
jgi:hypothetical protein